jgi:hypothetical protein
MRLEIQVMFTFAPPFIVVHVRWHDVQFWIKIIRSKWVGKIKKKLIGKKRKK